MTPPPLLRWLLRLYPLAHRERYGEEIHACLLRDLERSGGGARFWAGAVIDHLSAAAAVRRRARRNREGWMHTISYDLRHAARTLRRAPAFTAFATLTLALGIGATTAAFSVLDRVVLRPLPYPGAERMVAVGLARESDPTLPLGLNPPLLLALRGAPAPAEEVVAITTGFSVLGGVGDPVRVRPAQVTERFFGFFGADAAVGRLFTEGDHASGAEPVAVLGHDAWTARFQRDPSVVGRAVTLDGVPHTIVGVLAENFVPPEPLMSRTDGGIWMPFRLVESARAEGADRSYTLRAAARLRPAARPEDLEAHVSGRVEQLYGTYPRGFVRAAARDLRDLTVGETRSVLWRVVASVALLLAVACVNVAGLMLARASGRARELAVRSALGAGRRRLVRQLVSESVLLGLLGGASGGLLAFLAVEGFRRLSPGGIPRLAEVAVDARALAFSLTVALVAAAIFGVFPALRAAGRSTAAAARRGPDAPPDARVRGALVFAETALSVVLVMGAGLLAHDLVRRAQEDPGYGAEQLVAVRVALPSDRYGNDQRSASFWRELLESSRTLPGVVSATLAEELPTTAFGAGIELTPEGHDQGEMIATVRADTRFQTTLGLELVEGRWFSEADRDGELVVVVNRAFVDTYWPGTASAVGRSLRRGARAQNPTIVDKYWPARAALPDDAPWRVVGVVADTRVRPGVGAGPTVYVPLPEAATTCCMEVVARAAGDPVALAPELRALVRRLEPLIVDLDVRTVASLTAQALARPRFYTALFSAFGLVALLLALVGVYGATAYATRSRAREIGIRMALGARRRQVVSGVLARTWALLAGGVVVGLCVAALGSRALTDALLLIGPREASTYAMVAALVLAAGSAAALVPAYGASRVDPASTLRED